MRNKRATDAWLRGGAGPMKDRRTPRGGAQNRQAEWLAEWEENDDMRDPSQDPKLEYARDALRHAIVSLCATEAHINEAIRHFNDLADTHPEVTYLEIEAARVAIESRKANDRALDLINAVKGIMRAHAGGDEQNG